MITWMQKHRKYLVVTIWISTIAFVGAGFVGWGSYDFGSAGGKVAKVGDVELTKEQLTTTYSNIHNYYSKMVGGQLDEQTAKSLKLENMALQTLINQALLENFANELEIRVTDEEVASKIASMEPFLKGGKFDKNVYLASLQRVGMSPKDFEEGLKKEILIEKVSSFIKPVVSKEESDALAAAALSEDRVGVKILDALSFLKPADEASIKSFWEKNKSNFKTEPTCDIQSVEVSASNFAVTDSDIADEYAQNSSEYFKDGKKMPLEEAKEQVVKNAKIKLAKKEALKKYVELKDGKIGGKVVPNVPISPSAPIPSEIKSELLKVTKPTTLKPILVNDTFVVFKITKYTPSRQMSYEEAKLIAQISVEREGALAAMKSEAEKTLKGDFAVSDLGFISKNKNIQIPRLLPQESAEVANSIFKSKESKGVIYLPNKAVLFKVLEQKLLASEQSGGDKMVFDKMLIGTKASLVNQNVLEYLKNRYEVKLFISLDGNNEKR